VNTLEELERLGPFGPGNPEPVFTCRAGVRDRTVLKGRHLKLQLSAVNRAEGQLAPSSVIEAIWFNAAEDDRLLEGTAAASESEWAGVPELNRFRGRVTPTFRVRDWRGISE
jgi:single-stranded DNA-specific DHH superfamily exonuclease